VGDFLAIWTAEPGARIPSNSGGEGAVITVGDIPQCSGVSVEGRVDKSDRTGLRRINPRDQAGPQRSNGARPADDRVSPVDAHLITRLRIRNAAYIGDTPHAKRLCPTLSLRHLERVLIRRQCKKFAHTTAAGTTIT